MSEAIDLVSAALVSAQGEMPAAGFDATNPFLRNRYASLGEIIETSRPVLAKHGLAILQVPFCPDVDRVSVHTEIIHKSGQKLDGGILSLPLGDEKGKSRAQVAGSIVTYLRRYAWATVLGIYAEEDTDGNEPETRREPARAKSTPPKPTEASWGQPASQAATSATPQTRMKLLNQLEAAPGQPRRALILHYLQVAKWITGDQQPEDLPLEHVPKTQKQFEELRDDIRSFEMLQRQGEGQQENPHPAYGERL